MIRLLTNTLSIVLLGVIIACSTNKAELNHWISDTSENHGFCIEKENDTLLTLYSLQFNKCDTTVIGSHKFKIIESDQNRLSFRDYTSTGEIVINKDSSLIKISDEENSIVEFSLKNINDAAEFNKIIRTKLDLSSLLSDRIAKQEKLIAKYDTAVILANRADLLVKKAIKWKKKVMDEILVVNTADHICWNKAEGLDKVIIFPQSLKKANIYSALTDALNYEFIAYMDSIYKNCTCGFIAEELYSNKLHGINAETYATAGELIIYYNDLMLEVYKMSGMVNIENKPR